MIFPNLFVIGAMKCGTTSLHFYLNQHPDINMSVVKEPNYFAEDHGGRTLESYQSFFDPSYKYNGESSQSYSRRHISRWSGVAKRIFTNAGKNVKLIYIIRDPIERIRSHVFEQIAQKHVDTNNINQYLRSISDLSETDYLKTSQYYYQLEPYLTLFSAENIKVIQLEALMKNPMGVMTTVWNFLEISNHAHIDYKIENASKNKVNPTMFYWLVHNPLAKQLYRRYLSRWIDKTKILKKENPLFYSKITMPDSKLDDDVVIMLKKCLEDDLEKLKREFSIDLSLWPFYDSKGSF